MFSYCLSPDRSTEANLRKVFLRAVDSCRQMRDGAEKRATAEPRKNKDEMMLIINHDHREV
jgi:hypothetical protein